MTKEVDDLVDALTSVSRFLVKRAIKAINDVEDWAEKPSQESTHDTGTNATNFHIGEWHRFGELGEGYQVISPIKHLGNDWLVRIRLQDGSHAEYPLSNVRKDPLLEPKTPNPV